jgi:hypothetical protein
VCAVLANNYCYVIDVLDPNKILVSDWSVLNRLPANQAREFDKSGIGFNERDDSINSLFVIVECEATFSSG